jgi:hypothetical protein
MIVMLTDSKQNAAYYELAPRLRACRTDRCEYTEDSGYKNSPASANKVVDGIRNPSRTGEVIVSIFPLASQQYTDCLQKGDSNVGARIEETKDLAILLAITGGFADCSCVRNAQVIEKG